MTLNSTDAAAHEALVLRLRHRGAVVSVNGQEQEAVLRGRLLQGEHEFTSRIAVGDRVRAALKPEGWVIEGVLPRRSALSRKRQLTQQEQVLVANLDRAFFLLSLAEPGFRPRLVDRLLIAADRGGFEGILLFTKADLIDDRSEFEDWAELYRKLGITVSFISTRTGEGIEAMRTQMQQGISVVAGQSGVGKSTLLNALQPGLGLVTAEISRKWGKGQHTTTASSLHALVGGGWMADTPGIRSFALPRLEAAEVAAYFSEFRLFADECRFSACTHRHEPECAVIVAVEQGGIDARRYEGYLRIVEGVEEEQS
ncbi:MAG: ribosome small subunit-dependent GTPase A [Planctomycetes bacterium]|nr:ribosome small subunit-dependent GTPase A [Planctomycetota bacterium]